MTPGRLHRWEDAGKDPSSWPGLDGDARERASSHPELGIGYGYESDTNADATDYAGALLAPIHDAVMVEGPAENIDTVVAETQAATCETMQNNGVQDKTKRDTIKRRSDAKIQVSLAKPMKNATSSKSLRGGVQCCQKEYNTPEKHGENVDLLPSGAQCGANWSEIRVLIANCEDLPRELRGQLLALGDKFAMPGLESPILRPRG